MRTKNRPGSPSLSQTRGFTLVELMVVVAIICILAAIAVPNYKNYTTRARLTAMVAELSGGKVGVESLLMEGQVAPVITPAEVGLASQTELCSTISLTTYIQPGERRVRISCVGIEALVDLWYSSNGGWTCTVASPFNWTPENCRPF